MKFRTQPNNLDEARQTFERIAVWLNSIETRLAALEASLASVESLLTEALAVASVVTLNSRWTSIASSAWIATPPYVRFTSPSTYTAVGTWSALTAYALGDFVRPSTSNDLIYECVANGTTAAGEPAWGTTLGADTADGTVTWRARGLHVLQFANDQSASLVAGTPIRVKQGGTTYYGIVAHCQSSSSYYCAIYGAPLTYSGTITEIAYGKPEMVVEREFFIPGVWDASAADILDSLADRLARWDHPPGRLCHFAARNKTADTGTKPYVNLRIGGNSVFRNNADAGTQLTATAWVEAAPGSVNVSNYRAVRGDALEVRCGAAGGNTDAEDLIVNGVFVLE